MIVRILVVASLLLPFAGCGGGGDVDTASVTGKITYKGQPVKNANVIFTPVPPTEGPVAMGTTDDEGQFTMMSGESPGAVPGTHKVAIIPVSDEPEPMPGTPEANQPRPPPPIPAKYMDAERSGLTAEVKDGETNHFEWELKD